MPATADTIEIHLRTADQLYNSLDPSPFHDRDLDEKAERYIVGSARALQSRGQLIIVVTLPKEACFSSSAQHIPDTIQNYFTYRADQTIQDLRELLHVGLRYLMVGLPVLAVCFLAIQYMNISASSTTVQRLVEQSLLILGWVANWRPLEIFLYDWIPLRRQIHLFRRIASAAVELRPVDASS